MTKKGLPENYILDTNRYIDHPSEMIPMKNGLSTLLHIDNIIIPVEQVRKHFDDNSMEELRQSIKQNGLIQPIVVREENNGIYLVSGERRLRACKSLNMERIPVVFNNKQPDIISLIENLQREDLTPFEEAYAHHNLKLKYKITLSELGEIVGKDYKYLSRIMKLVELPDTIKNEFVTSRISKELLIRISQISDKQEQLRVWNILKTGDFTVKEAKKILKTRKLSANIGFDHKKINRHLNSIQSEIMKISDIKEIDKINGIHAFISDLENFLNSIKTKIKKSDNEVSKSDNEVN